MKIALIVPPMPYSLNDAPDLQFPPLALCYLGAVVRECGHEVSLIDMTVSNMNLDDLSREMTLKKPDIVGISCLSASYPNGIKIADFTREILPGTTIIMGGMHPTFKDEETLEKSSVDIVVRNEGEITIQELTAQLEKGRDGLNGVAGITYKDNSGGIVRTPDRGYISNLDDLPLPAYDLLETMPIYARLREFLVVSTRGCPHRCTFCSSSPFWGRRWRARSIANVMEEVHLLVDDFGSKNIVFGDDNFAFDKKRVLALCDAIAGVGGGIDWRCSVRADSLTKPLLKAMSEAGCSGIFMGVESGTQAALDRLGKGEKIERAVEAVAWCREVGIETTCAMLMGLPWETEQDIRNNISFVAERLKPDEVVWNLLHPDPGSEMYENMEKFGLQFAIDDPSRHIGNAPSVVSTPHLSADQLNRLWLEACLSAGVGEET